MGMKLIKQWHISFFDENDIAYLKGLGCDLEVNDKVKLIEVTGPNGRVYQMADRNSNYGIYVTTTTEKQESMLMLKYSGEIQLLRAFYADEWLRYEL